MSPIELYILFFILGLFLLAIEVFVPGGVLGACGFASLLTACVLGFKAFPAPWGAVSFLGILAGSSIGLLLWLKYFPRTAMGKALTLDKDATDFKASIDLSHLLDKSGIAQTDLRPAGIVLVEKERIDVLAENGWIEKDTPVKIVAISGNRVTVRQV